MTLKMLQKHNLYLIFIGIQCMLMTGCGRSSDMTTSIIATPHINPDNIQVSKPVVVTIYQLTQPIPFKTLSYSQLTQQYTTALGPNLVDYTTVELRPKETKKQAIKIYRSTKTIGIVAQFHQMNKSKWRSVIGLPAHYRKLKLEINISSNRIDAYIKKAWL